MIETTRLRLIPASLSHVQAEIGDRARFAQLLQARVPENWPPESAADALPLFLSWLEGAPEQVGWFGWYALWMTPPENHGPTLVGGGGFLGPPNHGEVQMGYSMLPQFQGRGIATEMVAGLVGWALNQAGVTCIVAETEWENPGLGAGLNENRIRLARRNQCCGRHALRAAPQSRSFDRTVDLGKFCGLYDAVIAGRILQQPVARFAVNHVSARLSLNAEVLRHHLRQYRCGDI